MSDVYPRPSNLRAVERAIRRLAPDAALQATILAAVEAQKRWPTLARENGRFFPDLDKWVRGEKWRDQPPSLHRGAAPTSTGWTPPVITDSDRAAAQKILASKPTFLTNGSAPRRSPGDRP